MRTTVTQTFKRRYDVSNVLFASSRRLMRSSRLLPKPTRPPLPRRAPVPSALSDDGDVGPTCLPPPPPRWDCLSRRISSAEHLRQLLSHAVVAGLLAPATPSFPSGGDAWNPRLPFLNLALQTLAGGQSPEHAVSLYGAMRRGGLVPDDYTFTFALKAAARLGLPRGGEQLHSLSLKLGFGFNVFVQNSLIHMYFACGVPGTARQVFDTMPHSVRDVVSWNSMISGCLQSDRCGEALRVFMEMANRSVAPDVTTLVNALISCGRTGAVDVGRRIHAAVIVNGFDLDFFLGSSLIDMYAKCGFTDDARRTFDIMPEKNAVCWTSMISGYAHAGDFRASVELFRDMQVARVKPDEATIASVVSACGQLGALDQGRWVDAYWDMSGTGVNLKVKNALIDMYSKCGDMKRALQIFHSLDHQDVFSWTAAISGLAMNGYSYEALDLFSRMEFLHTVMPNEVTFLGVLSACSHSGLVEKGFYYFSTMTEVYKLIPKIQHYGCMVDLLGRAKLVVEAVSFIKKMPIQPDLIIWRSLLFACRNSGNIKLAELAIRYITELEPRKPGAHVLLSNAYASASKWREANVVRKDMSSSGIRKQPGCSFVEVNGVVHEFFVADTSHCQIDVIHQMLLGLNELLWTEGYVCTKPRIK